MNLEATMARIRELDRLYLQHDRLSLLADELAQSVFVVGDYSTIAIEATARDFSKRISSLYRRRARRSYAAYGRLRDDRKDLRRCLR